MIFATIFVLSFILFIFSPFNKRLYKLVSFIFGKYFFLTGVIRDLRKKWDTITYFQYLLFTIVFCFSISFIYPLTILFLVMNIKMVRGHKKLNNNPKKIKS